MMGKSLLRDCRACGNELSRHSAFCRHCGHPQAPPVMIWLLVLFLLLTIAFYLAFTIYGMYHVQDFRVYGISKAGLTACLIPNLRSFLSGDMIRWLK